MAKFIPTPENGFNPNPLTLPFSGRGRPCLVGYVCPGKPQPGDRLSGAASLTEIKMPLPKTYWNDLSEEAQIAFFDFWMSRENTDLCKHCPINDTISGCKSLCGILFKKRHHGNCYYYTGFDCPCHYYGSEDAIAALEKAIMDWIGE